MCTILGWWRYMYIPTHMHICVYVHILPCYVYVCNGTWSSFAPHLAHISAHFFFSTLQDIGYSKLAGIPPIYGLCKCVIFLVERRWRIFHHTLNSLSFSTFPWLHVFSCLLQQSICCHTPFSFAIYSCCFWFSILIGSQIQALFHLWCMRSLGCRETLRLVLLLWFLYFWVPWRWKNCHYQCLRLIGVTRHPLISSMMHAQPIGMHILVLSSLLLSLLEYFRLHLVCWGLDNDIKLI